MIPLLPALSCCEHALLQCPIWQVHVNTNVAHCMRAGAPTARFLIYLCEEEEETGKFHSWNSFSILPHFNAHTLRACCFTAPVNHYQTARCRSPKDFNGFYVPSEDKVVINTLAAFNQQQVLGKCKRCLGVVLKSEQCIVYRCRDCEQSACAGSMQLLFDDNISGCIKLYGIS